MSNLQTALNLARSGYYVHPLAPKGKVPIAGGNGSNDATRDEDVIRAWWDATPNANVGIGLDKTGIVDIAPDCTAWAERFRANGIPRTLLYTSNSAWHTLYRLPPGGPVARVCVQGQYDIMSQGNAVAPGSIHPSGRTYELHTPLLPVEDLPLAPDWAIAILQAHVKDASTPSDDTDWLELPSGATLAHSRRFQALCKANEQLRAVCAGEAVTLTTKEGGQDSSVSIQRAVFVNQLLRAKYPHNEIRSLARHFIGVLESHPKWYTTDIDRLIRDYTPKGYTPEATRGPQPPRGGRHYEITAGELLDHYHSSADCGVLGIVLEWSVTEAAARLGVSSGTIKRREAELIDAGHIVREYGRVILSPDTWNIGSQRSAMLQTEDLPAENTIGSQFDLPQQDAEKTPENAVCEEQARDLEITHFPTVLPTPRVRRSGPWFYVADGVRCGATASTEAEAWEKWEPCNGCTLEPAATLRVSTFDDSDQPEIATYTPVDLPHAPYSGITKHTQDTEARYKLVWESMRRRDDAELPPNVISLRMPPDPDADDPLVRCAPSDPKAAREYYALKNKKAKSAKQAIWMRRRLAELEVLMPLSEWGEQPAPGGVWLRERVLSRAAGPQAQL